VLRFIISATASTQGKTRHSRYGQEIDTVPSTDEDKFRKKNGSHNFENLSTNGSYHNFILRPN
jgi:hypothetical protein